MKNLYSFKCLRCSASVASLRSRLKRAVSIDTRDEGKKWNERRRRGLREARISRHEIAVASENLTGLYNRSESWSCSQDAARGEREKERTGA